MSGQYKIKSLLCAAAFVLLAVAAVLVVKYWHHTLPAEECGEVYCRYSNRDDLKVSFLKDFRINDSVFVDVTLLEATDSVGWNKLVEELNLVTPDSASQCDLDKGMDLIFLKQVKKDNYSQKAITPSGNVDVLATSYLKKKVTVFHTKNRNEKYSVFHYNYDISTNQ